MSGSAGAFYWAPKESELRTRYRGDRDLQKRSAVQMGLNLCEPGKGRRRTDHVLAAAPGLFETFARMAMNARRSSELIAADTPSARTHGAADQSSMFGPEPKGLIEEQVGSVRRTPMAAAKAMNDRKRLEVIWTRRQTWWTQQLLLKSVRYGMGKLTKARPVGVSVEAEGRPGRRVPCRIARRVRSVAGPPC